MSGSWDDPIIIDMESHTDPIVSSNTETEPIVISDEVVSSNNETDPIVISDEEDLENTPPPITISNGTNPAHEDDTSNQIHEGWDSRTTDQADYEYFPYYASGFRMGCSRAYQFPHYSVGDNEIDAAWDWYTEDCGQPFDLEDRKYWFEQGFLDGDAKTRPTVTR